MKKIVHEELEDELEDDQYTKRQLLLDIVSVTTAVSILVCAVGKGIDLFVNRNNIFENNQITLSEDEIEQLYVTLDQTLNVSLSEDNDGVLLLNAIYENENLTEDEKDIFYNYLSLIEENPYLNKEDAYRSLRNVDVLYVDRPMAFNDSVLASYSYLYIKVYDDLLLEDVLYHEGIHCIFSHFYTSNLPFFFSEGMTELLTKEYFSSDPFCTCIFYPCEVSLVKILCELVGSDQVLKAYTTGDMSEIYDSLASIKGTSKDAKDLISRINHSIEEYSNDKVIHDQEAFFASLDELQEYVEEKYSEHSLEYFCCNYYDGIVRKGVLESPFDEVLNYFDDYGICQKAYFSERLKESYSDYDFVDFIQRDLILVPKVKQLP